MLALEEYVINTLTKDAVLTQTVPADNILFGPVDVPVETQQDLIYPQINIYTMSDKQRTVPLGVRDSSLSIHIFSRNDQIEVETIFERIVQLLAFQDVIYSNSRIFWGRLEGTVDQYESGARIWHRVSDFIWWVKPL